MQFERVIPQPVEPVDLLEIGSATPVGDAK